MPTRNRAEYMQEYRARRKVAAMMGIPAPSIEFIDVPVIEGVATLPPDGRTVRVSTPGAKFVRVALPRNLPKPEPYVEPEERIAELEAEVARLKRELAARPDPRSDADRIIGAIQRHATSFGQFRPAPKPGKK